MKRRQPSRRASVSPEFEIPSDWKFTRAHYRGQTEFLFHPTANCLGYRLCLAGWKLVCMNEKRRASAAEADPLTYSEAEIRRVFGDRPFRHPDVIRSELNAAQKRRELQAKYGVAVASPQGGFMRRPINDPGSVVSDVEKLQRKHAAAVVEAMFAAGDVGCAWVALVHLCVTKKARFRIEKGDWPLPKPPAILLHASPTGFESGRSLGTFAASPTPGTYWVVSHFGRCDVTSQDADLDALKAEIDGLRLQLAKDGEKTRHVHRVTTNDPGKHTPSRRTGSVGTPPFGKEYEFDDDTYIVRRTMTGERYTFNASRQNPSEKPRAYQILESLWQRYLDRKDGSMLYAKLPGANLGTRWQDAFKKPRSGDGKKAFKDLLRPDGTRVRLIIP